MILASLLVSPVFAQPMPRLFSEAAAEFGVPESVLLALAHESSGWDPDITSQWGGYGLFDLREPGEGGMDIEQAAMLLELSPDDLIDHPRHNIRGAAALLAASAASGGDAMPAADDLLAWWGPVQSFSASHSESLQDMYAAYVFELINTGIEPHDSGLSLSPVAIDYRASHAQPIPPPGSSCDYPGCYQYTSASSANYTNDSRSASDISYVVIHTVQGSYSGCISWFQNSDASVSAHYVVRSSDGQITQMVKEADVGWHAGNWTYNEASVGIEHEGYVDDPGTWYTDEMYAASAALTADILSRNGIPISRNNVIGHVEVPGATHTDPGSGWDWDYYMALIADGGGGTFTGDVLGVIAAKDIYHGARLTDATVWIEETGETATTDDEGKYYFYDLPLDSYTIHADAPGYLEGTCDKSVVVGDNWCSIALMPGEDGNGGDTGELNVDPGDPGEEAGEGAEGASIVGSPGTAHAISELGCATSRTGSGAAALLVALGLLLPGRRRRS